jgi:hypothetical protein
MMCQHKCASNWAACLVITVLLCLLQGHPYNNPPRCLHFTGSSARICVVHNPIGTYLVSNDTQVRICCRKASNGCIQTDWAGAG